MIVSAYLSAAITAYQVSALPLSDPIEDYSVHESVSTLPSGWKFYSEAAEHGLVDLRIVHTKEDDKILQLASAISDPDHQQYAQYISAEEIYGLTNQFDLGVCQKVYAWLQSNGISDATCHNGSSTFTTTIANANKMLRSKFLYYQLNDSDPVLRTEQYSVPSRLTGQVDFIFPTVHFMTPGSKPRNELEPRQHGVPTGPQNCSNSICPQNLTSMYNINYYPKDNCSGSKIAITGFIGNFPNKTDVETFLKEAGLPSQSRVPNYSLQVVKNGPTETPSTTVLIIEPNLDLDYSLAFTGPLPLTFISVGGKGVTLQQPGNKQLPDSQSANEPYLDFLEALIAEKNPPQVISISYSDDEQSVPIRYAQRVCNLMAHAAVRGITIIGSSGDGGAAGTYPSNCIGPDGKHRTIPTFPSSCPWMTSVGAIASYGGPASYSSGGFSNYFAVPTWQSVATKDYIQSLNGSGKGYYNASGRGIPDISLLGDGYLIKAAGFNQTQKGTSASAPVFASMIALLNDLRLRAGKPVLGHINPLLYSGKLKSAIKDIISEFGSSAGCSDGDFIFPGWIASKGWDASTGLGEPNFAKLRNLLA